jgi:hypothetical protein
MHENPITKPGPLYPRRARTDRKQDWWTTTQKQDGCPFALAVGLAW